MKELDLFEQLFLELLGEFQSLSTSEGRLREAYRAETTRAQEAEAARDAAERAATDAKNTAAAAAASATQAAAALSQAQEELTGLRMQIDLGERQRILLEERCSVMSLQLSMAERELQQLQPLQSVHAALQRQYVELQDMVRKATEHARSESSRLEAELRRVERCASGGSELRERARLAAAAHARERKLAAAELQHATTELQAANAEAARLRLLVAELQLRNTNRPNIEVKEESDSEILAELRATLEAERAGSARLERALAAALADNASLAANLHAIDNVHSAITISQPNQDPTATNIGAIDSFLAE